MKWLNILTDSEEFSEIAYELYSTQEDKDRYSQYVTQISVLCKEKTTLFNSNLDKLLKYVKKSKKRAEEVYSAAPNEDDIIVFTALGRITFYILVIFERLHSIHLPEQPFINFHLGKLTAQRILPLLDFQLYLIGRENR